MSAVPTIAVALLYLVPVVLIALLFIRPDRRQARCLILMTLLALPLFYITHYLLLQQIQGWPSQAPVPQKFRLLGFDITEPDNSSGESGQILLWAKGINDDQPRVHQLAYRKELHQELVAAGQRRASGRPQIGSRGRRPDSNPDGPRGDTLDIIRFQDMKARSLPSKD